MTESLPHQHRPGDESDDLHRATALRARKRQHRARSALELAGMVGALKAQFPKLSDFERDFPSPCFALATGVGKTRLMALSSAT